MLKYSLLVIFLMGTLNSSQASATVSCPVIHTNQENTSAPLLSGRQVVDRFDIKPARQQEFLWRFSHEVENDYTWAQAGNPRITPSGDSLVVDMYRFQDFNMSDQEKINLINQRKSVPGKIQFKHLLFQSVL